MSETKEDLKEELWERIWDYTESSSKLEAVITKIMERLQNEPRT